MSVPIGTYTPWALRTDFPGATDEMIGYFGTFIPLATTPNARTSGDERPSISELYPTRASYDRRVEAEVNALVAAGWLLERDRARIRSAAADRWEWITRDPQ